MRLYKGYIGLGALGFRGPHRAVLDYLGLGFRA